MTARLLQSLMTAPAMAVLIVSAAPAQLTNREKAVAIERVPVPLADRYEIEVVGPPLATPWSLAFLPDGSFLVSEKRGGLRHILADGSAGPALAGGPPDVFRREDSGLLDVALDPDFGSNRTIYLAFVEGGEEANRTAVWKARLDSGRLVGGRVIFRVNETKKGPSHPGGRMLFLPDKTFLLTVGDGFDYRGKAQDPATHMGKILRLTRDGKAPRDNPFVGRPGYLPEIWTLGNRNVQGLALDLATGAVWAHEHGPRGGDEINRLAAGRNYGWPRTTFGIDYDGTVITDRSHAPGVVGPNFVWTPSIAPSGLAVYRGARFPELEGRLLVGALAARALVQVRIGAESGLLSEEGRWLTGLKARIRDVRVAPDGHLYLLTDDERGHLLRLVQSSAPAISADRPLASLAFLIGRWSGESRFTPPFRADRKPVEESSQIDCVPALEATYIRCTMRFHRQPDGRLRVIEHYINRDPAKRGASVIVFDSKSHDSSSYSLEWSEAEQAWVALVPTKLDGQPAIERIVDKPSPDRSTLVHTESIRLDAAPEAAWTETFRWTWTRR